MPLYERREGGRAVERVRTVPGSFEDTRLGLLHQDREEHKRADGWHLVDETPAPGPAAAPTEKPKQDSGG
ncbi:hypothetical protein [Nocardiopsis tropica]|uniref:Uncharacterized protein n=1 Tax=Nocardiopsis tropica TaxID=109330 RepID=A0ABU7KLZ3_9ACTN|nr:hypothetical protein [Nocardiopsis umidischolae]MEE2050310.1 hypothetical protein [Nocardiopsis umidischolae]